MNVDYVNRKNTILTLLEQHESWRSASLNLVAAENAMSPIVRSLLASDLTQRYGDYTGRNLRARRYLGTHYIAELEVEVAKLACEVLHAEFVELRPVSGHVAGNAVLMALCTPGDLVVEVGPYDGGHRVAAKFAMAPLIDLQVEFLPFDVETYNIDVQKTLDYVKERRPRVVLVGASNFLFPVPLTELADGIKEYPETVLVYDASHVLGLITGGRFQDPLKEGAHLALGGTQKSFPGPQGGLIYSNSESMIEAISSSVHPAMLSNHHLARLPSLGLALLEMKLWGADYAAQVITNAQCLAQSLVDQQVPVVGFNGKYTESHTVLVNTGIMGSIQSPGERLEEAGLIVTNIRLPEVLGGSGLRIGTNEITRRGGVEDHMREIACLIADILLSRRSVGSVKTDVQAMAESLSGYDFTWAEPEEG